MGKKIEYFAFTADSIDVAIPVSTVQKVVMLPELKFLPNLPASAIGLLNYHGSVFPVFDLRLRFNLPANELSLNVKIVLGIVDDFKFGIVATDIMGVIEVDEQHEKIDERIQTGDSKSEEYIKYAGKIFHINDPFDLLLSDEYEKLKTILNNNS